MKKGGEEDASGESYTDMAKNLLTGNFGKNARVSPPPTFASYDKARFSFFVLTSYRGNSTHQPEDT